ncbi:uncharacterized protein ACRADG_002117 [Cochliomyia hominivorax]
MPTESKIRAEPKTSLVNKKQESSDSSSLKSLGKRKINPAKEKSTSTVHIQHLQFPDTIPDKSRIFKVKCPKNLDIKPPESTTTPTPKERGYDFTSSTNSDFKQMVLTVPKKFRVKCSSSTSSEVKPKHPLESIKTLDKEILKERETSQELQDSEHQISRRSKQKLEKPWQRPCEASFVAGAPRKYVGTCPHNYEQLAKLSKSRQKFFLTQDPRRVHCLHNPEVLRRKEFSAKREFNTLTKMVKQAQNLCVATDSETSEDFICEVIDLENPLQLDFQGLDYSNTYQKDEQDLQNQRNYRRVKRYMERRRVKKETKEMVEEELHEELINIPKCYEVKDRREPNEPEPLEMPPKLAKLYRSDDKPFNQNRINQEKERRVERYKDLYLKKKAVDMRKKDLNNKTEKLESENLALTLADKNFKETIKNIEESFKEGKVKQLDSIRLQKELLEFPHTIKDTQKFRNQLKLKNRIKQDKAKLTQEFFLQRKGKLKQFPEVDIDSSSDSIKEEAIGNYKYNDQSSDDEDNMIVGQEENKFKLRGFQFKLGPNLRGKYSQREKLEGLRKEKSCKTREQWLKELAPRKQQIKLDKEIGLQKVLKPDDPELILFPPLHGFKTPKAEKSNIKEFIHKPLAQHYDRTKQKTIKFAKPRLRYSVKKFNLIKYRFGDSKQKLNQFKEQETHFEEKLKLKTTEEYIKAKDLALKRAKEEMKLKRLQLLGIPCRPLKKSRLQTKCENSSSSSDTDWVPSHENYKENYENDRFFEIKPLRLRCNMPAPKYREPTLTQHPRKPRDYQQLRVPSAVFQQIVATSNLPFLHKLDEDKIEFANVELKKTPYTDKFEARHHHDHWNATQTKQVRIHYQPQLKQAEIKENVAKFKTQFKEEFLMAEPPCNEFVEMNLTLKQYDIEEMLKEHRKQASKFKTPEKEILKMTDLCTQQDFILRTRDSKELPNLDYPGRQEYRKLIEDIKETFKECKQIKDTENKLFINERELIQELEEDLKSIESCLTSLSSSVCTNLTHDSGSYLLMEGQEKLPLDFIRKSIIPFEELQRSRFQFEPIDQVREQNNPFQCLPFSGQKKAQLQLNANTDSFFTFNTRLKNGMRLRLEVPFQEVTEKLLGRGKHKYKAQVITDIDENYIKELKTRPPIKLFKYKTGQNVSKQALRLKFESLIIQGQIVRAKIYERLNEQHWQDMHEVKKLFENLFNKWEKQEYDEAMKVVYQVKQYYDESDRLTKEMKDLERDLVILNMDIVFIEGHWVRGIMLQNFHYLMGDQEWRLQNDWIHRKDSMSITEEGNKDVLENFQDSISKRSTVNIRKRDKDDAWAIKTYYEETYLPNKHENLIVFPHPESFLLGLENLKSKTFILLLEMHFSLSLHTELQYKLETFTEWCAQDLQQQQEYVNRKCAKLYFLNDRVKWLQQKTLKFLEKPIENCFNDTSFLKDRATIAQAWRYIVPYNLRGSGENDMYTIDMVSQITEVIMDLIDKFENIPTSLSQQIENKIRFQTSYRRKLSYQAYHIEKRIAKEMQKVVKNLEPPYEKPKKHPSTKLPRYYLRKPYKPPKIEEKKISERAKLFYRAFHDDDLPLEGEEFKTGFQPEDDEMPEHIVPFYFDHFLKINGYTPNYNFKTQIELRDGPEIDRLQVKSVIPEVEERMQQWEIMKRKIMEENIAKNPKMYVDVMT